MPVTIRKHDVQASNLLFLGYGLILLTLFIQLPPSYEKLLAKYSPSMLWIAGAFVLIYLGGIGIGVRRGYRWVKVFFVLITVWDIIHYIVNFPPAEGLTLKTTLFLLATIAKAWAAVIVTKDLLTSHTPAAPEAGVAEGGV